MTKGWLYSAAKRFGWKLLDSNGANNGTVILSKFVAPTTGAKPSLRPKESLQNTEGSKFASNIAQV